MINPVMEAKKESSALPRAIEWFCLRKSQINWQIDPTDPNPMLLLFSYSSSSWISSGCLFRSLSNFSDWIFLQIILGSIFPWFLGCLGLFAYLLSDPEERVIHAASPMYVSSAMSCVMENDEKRRTIVVDPSSWELKVGWSRTEEEEELNLKRHSNEFIHAWKDSQKVYPDEATVL
jgi:hypothetical protein